MSQQRGNTTTEMSKVWIAFLLKRGLYRGREIINEWSKVHSVNIYMYICIFEQHLNQNLHPNGAK